MPTDDKKEYKDLLVILNHIGTGPTVLNKLSAAIQKLEDPKLKGDCERLFAYLDKQPEVRSLKKFQILGYASRNAGGTDHHKNASNFIYGIQQHCQTHIDSQVPQWQLIAQAAGWKPPAPAASSGT